MTETRWLPVPFLVFGWSAVWMFEKRVLAFFARSCLLKVLNLLPGLGCLESKR